MALRYEYAFNIARVGSVAVKVTDAATFEVSFSAGTYAHTAAANAAFAVDFQAALNTGSAGARTYTVSYAAPTPWYTISATGGNFSLSFTTTTDANAGVRMRQLLGMSGNRSGAATYSSQVRPYYVVVPAFAGRSALTDDMEPDNVVAEAVADDGTAYLIGPATVEKQITWVQHGDVDLPPNAYTMSGLGTPVHKRFATNAVPWTWEHAFEHHRTGFDAILVADGSEQLVCRTMAAHASFRPRRFGGDDHDLWSVPFGVRLIARL